MRKIYTLLLTATMVLAACGAQTSQSPQTTTQSSANIRQPLTGEWKKPASPVVTDVLQTLFDKGVQSLEGVHYKPLVFLGSQEGNSNRYAFFCTKQVDVLSKSDDYVIVYLRENARGEVELLDLFPFAYTPNMPVEAGEDIEVLETGEETKEEGESRESIGEKTETTESGGEESQESEGSESTEESTPESTKEGAEESASAGSGESGKEGTKEGGSTEKASETARGNTGNTGSGAADSTERKAEKPGPWAEAQPVTLSSELIEALHEAAKEEKNIEYVPVAHISSQNPGGNEGLLCEAVIKEKDQEEIRTYQVVYLHLDPQEKPKILGILDLEKDE